MNAYFKQDEPDTRNLLDTGKQGVIGKALSRPEGLAKVTGTAPYSAEYQIDGCLEGVLVTAPFARGRITAIDKKAALAMDGVIAVIDDPRMTTRPAQGTAAAAPEQAAEPAPEPVADTATPEPAAPAKRQRKPRVRASAKETIQAVVGTALATPAPAPAPEAEATAEDQTAGDTSGDSDEDQPQRKRGWWSRALSGSE